MQKKLLSLLLLSACSIMCGEDSTLLNATDQTVPVMSKEEFAEKNLEYQQSEKEVKNAQKILRKKKKARNNLESVLYSYMQRNGFAESMISQLTNNSSDIAKYREQSDTKNKSLNQQLKNEDNGISYTYLGGLTDPKKDTRCDEEYRLINQKTQKRNSIDERLEKEMLEYASRAQEILLKIDEHLSDQAATFDNNIRSFGRCDYCRSNEVEYKECLKKKRIAKISEKSIEQSEDEIVQDTYNFMRDRNIPVTQENILQILATNKITKGNFLKMRTSKDKLAKAIRGELVEQSKDKPKVTQELQEEFSPLADNPPKLNAEEDEK